MFFTTCGSRNPLTLGSLENPRTAKAHILLGCHIQTYYMSSGLPDHRPSSPKTTYVYEIRPQQLFSELRDTCDGLGSAASRWDEWLLFPSPRRANLYTYTHHMHLRWFPRGTPSSFPESYLCSS